MRRRRRRPPLADLGAARAAEVGAGGVGRTATADPAGVRRRPRRHRGLRRRCWRILELLRRRRLLDALRSSFRQALERLFVECRCSLLRVLAPAFLLLGGIGRPPPGVIVVQVLLHLTILGHAWDARARQGWRSPSARSSHLSEHHRRQRRRARHARQHRRRRPPWGRRRCCCRCAHRLRGQSRVHRASASRRLPVLHAATGHGDPCEGEERRHGHGAVADGEHCLLALGHLLVGADDVDCRLVLVGMVLLNEALCLRVGLDRVQGGRVLANDGAHLALLDLEVFLLFPRAGGGSGRCRGSRSTA
mmetsp:Transcript_110591/g.319538  ORF Transcript_110591/g.319538 Transcript_110591/m.319538 type:complete len:305 (-) Transcript_110591:113-1027(-)